jgi:hypothetical protein
MPWSYSKADQGFGFTQFSRPLSLTTEKRQLQKTANVIMSGWSRHSCLHLKAKNRGL